MNDLLYKATQGFENALAESKKAIIEVIKANGGIVRTIPEDFYQLLFPIQATFELDSYESSSYPSNVYAVCYVEGEGIGVLTSNGICNYRYDNDLDTECEATEFIDEVLKDVSYFEFLDNYYPRFDMLNTIFSIVAGLGEFVA